MDRNNKRQILTKPGLIIPNGVVLKPHENNTVIFLTKKGYDVELIPKSNASGVHTPDILMGGIAWEMKSPKGEGKYLISNTIQRAVKQSQNIIIDLRRAKRNQSKCVREIKREFENSRAVNRIKIILDDVRCIDLEK